MAENTFKLFGFEITRTKDKKALASPVPSRADDGAGYVTATSAGSHYGHYINMEGDDSKDNAQLILKYRGSAMHPEADAAIEDIVNEAITASELKPSVELNLDNVPVSASIKKKARNMAFIIATYRFPDAVNFEQLEAYSYKK